MRLATRARPLINSPFLLSIVAMAAITLFPRQGHAAGAQNYGRYYCGDCGSFAGIITGNGASLGEITDFLRYTTITSRWVPGDIVTVCNGTQCVDIKWATTVWIPVSPPYKDTKKSYKNDTAVNSQPAPNVYDVSNIYIDPANVTIQKPTITIGPLIYPDEPTGPSSGSGTGDYGVASVGGC